MSRGGRLLTAATLCSLVALGPAAAAQPGGTAPTVPPITVSLSSVTPTAPQPGDTLVVRMLLHNTTSSALSSLTAQLLYDPQHVGYRGEFDAYADTDPTEALTPALRVAPDVAVTTPATTLAAGAQESLTLSVPVDALGLAASSWQVYELAVQVEGLSALGFGPLGRLRTFLPWAVVGTPGAGKPTPVSWLWPLVDRPHRSVGATWVDDALAPQLASGGRLAGLVAAGAAAQSQHQPAPPPTKKRRKSKHPLPPVQPRPTIVPVPVTWALDPALVDDASAMTDGYRVGSGGATHPGRGAAAAHSWLAALRSAVSGGNVLGLPYADPDVVAAVRAGLSNEVQLATRGGAMQLDRILGVTPLGYAWPPSGLVDEHTLDTMYAGGVSTVVLDDRALPPLVAPNETPDAHTVVRARDGSLDAVLTDHVLDDVVDAGAADPSQSAAALQRFLAETLMIQAEHPFDQRTVVVAPARDWDPAPAYAAELLADTGRVPWIAPVSLAQAAASPVSTTVTRGVLAYPVRARRAELPHTYLTGTSTSVHAIGQSVTDFRDILLPPGTARAQEYDVALWRLLSAAWRTDLDGGLRLRSAVSGELAGAMRRVHVASPEGSFVTLTSHSGVVPVTVTNDLDTPVRVVVRLRSLQLKVSGRSAVTIPAHRQAPADVNATAQTSGVFPLTVSLLTPTGARYGPDVHLFVRSTAYGLLALVITGVATGVLLLAVVVRLVRRALVARRTRVAS